MAIVHQIYWTPHKIGIHKVKAHIQITNNVMENALANKDTDKDKPNPIARIHIAHKPPTG